MIQRFLNLSYCISIMESVYLPLLSIWCMIYRYLIIVLFRWTDISYINLLRFFRRWNKLYDFTFIRCSWRNRTIRSQTILRIASISFFKIKILIYWIFPDYSLSDNITTNNNRFISKMSRILNWYVGHWNLFNVLVEYRTSRSMRNDMIWWSDLIVTLAVRAIMRTWGLKCYNFAKNSSTMIIVHNSKLLYS